MIAASGRTVRVQASTALVVGLGVALLSFLGFDQAYGQSLPAPLRPQIEIKYLAGKKLDRRNQKPISVWWREAPFGDRLVRFANTEMVAVMIDRRVDRGQLIDLGVDEVSLEQFLWQTSTAAELGVCRVEDCYYFGPPAATAVLPVVVDDLANMVKQRVSKRSPVKWSAKRPLLSGVVVSPHAILSSLADANGFSIEGLEQLPPDLWHEFSLPPTTLYTRVQLILTGFGKSFEIKDKGRKIEIVDMPEIESASRDFTLGQPITERKEIADQFPELLIRFRSKVISAKGPPIRLAALKAILVDRVQMRAGKQKVNTMRTQATRLAILKTIAAAEKVELVSAGVDPSILAEVIDLNVVKVSMQELIFQTLKGTSLQGKIEAGKLEVLPSP